MLALILCYPKRAVAIAITFVMLALPGCAGSPSLPGIVGALTQPFANPASETNLYQAKLAFAASQELVLKYQRDCFGSQLPPYPVSVAVILADASLSVQCSRRVSRYNAMKAAENKANAAISAADGFIRLNPTGNAASYIAAAWAAVNEYKAKAGG